MVFPRRPPSPVQGLPEFGQTHVGTSILCPSGCVHREQAKGEIAPLLIFMLRTQQWMKQIKAVPSGGYSVRGGAVRTVLLLWHVTQG